MTAHAFHPAPFLRAVGGTEPFRAYCELRAIRITPGGPDSPLERWAAAIAALPPETQATIELELAQVDDLASPAGNAHLLEAAAGGLLPTDDLPSGAPLALWFLVRRSDLFRDVFFHHEVSEVHTWRSARAAPGLTIADPVHAAAALGEEVRAFFREAAGTGRFCAAEARVLPNAVCFAVRVADRIQLIEHFADDGTAAYQRLRPALAVLFVYSPADGSVRLKSPVRAADRVRDLFQRFGRSVLGHPVAPLGEAFDLDRLKRPLLLLPDGEDMGTPRVKALHLRYPSHRGRRTVKLETLLGDAPGAIEDLLAAHVANISDLTVCHAEITIPIRTGERVKSHLVRLWPDRCNLNQAPLGERLRCCLSRWGLRYA